MGVRDDAEAIAPELVGLRRAIHREPEIGLDLPGTQRKVLAALDGLPLEISLGTALSSVTAVLRGEGAAALGDDAKGEDAKDGDASGGAGRPARGGNGALARAPPARPGFPRPHPG